VDIHVFDQQQDLKISPEAVSAIVKAVLLQENKQCDEVSIHFVETSKICDLHEEFFNDPTTTDCISFPIDEPNTPHYCVLGEVFVCPKTAIDYGTTHNLCPYEETTLYIVHGMLHLLGYDDLGDEEPEMRNAEKVHMKNLKKHNLILRTCLKSSNAHI